MKIQLDTTNKTVKVEESVKVIELINTLKRLLPKEWEQFTIETHTIINWQNPVVIKEYPEWWKQPWYCTNGIELNSTTKDFCAETCQLKEGIFNIEV